MHGQATNQTQTVSCGSGGCGGGGSGIGPWLAEAGSFAMNADFDMPAAPPGKELALDEVMDAMKAQSQGKGTIQALSDKIVLNAMLTNMGVPQMPLLFAAYSSVDRHEVEALVRRMESDPDEAAFDIVAKPTHLSNGAGTKVFSKKKWVREGWTADRLIEHMESHLCMRAADCESEALKSLVPGFVIQPRYRSDIDFGLPIEVRIVTLWGKARCGIWWWGRPGHFEAGDGSKPQRTTWLTRQSRTPGRLASDDVWETVHEHRGDNQGFAAALALIARSMPAMAAAAESVASAVGAPFLRTDFFVGSKAWGVRLNEVAYGSGCDFRRLAQPSCPAAGTVDDGPAVASILQAGLRVAQRLPADHFLARLGADGASYEGPWWQFWRSRQAPSMSVREMPLDGGGLRLPLDALKDLGAERGAENVAFKDCQTPAALVRRNDDFHRPGTGRVALSGHRGLGGCQAESTTRPQSSMVGRHLRAGMCQMPLAGCRPSCGPSMAQELVGQRLAAAAGAA